MFQAPIIWKSGLDSQAMTAEEISNYSARKVGSNNPKP
jgi:hypothetical protein